MTDAMMWEIAKTVLQLAATAGIAWFTITAALRRFKAEKTWERRFDAYSRSVTALGNMQAVIHQWLSDIELRVQRGEAQDQVMYARYQASKVELEQCIAIARLILPDETFQTLKQARAGLDRVDWNDQYGTYDRHADLIGEALQKIADQGRAALL